MEQFDLIVIGGGSGGIATANRAAEYGAKVAVIEEAEVGGTCVNRGCVPKKASWYMVKVNDAINKYGSGYGFQIDEEVSFDYGTFLKARDGYVSRARQGYYNQFEKNKVELIKGRAQLLGNSQVEVEGEKLQGKYIVIATGGRPKRLDVPGADLVDNSDDFFNWTTLPETVAVVGAGYIAVELAQVLNSLNVKTYLAVRYDRPLRRFDQTITDELLHHFQLQGLNLMPQTSFDEYRRNDDGKIECLSNGQVLLTVDRVIQAIGRDANTENLGLENTVIQLTQSGRIDVNEKHETAEKNVYAIGDVIEGIDLTPVAIRAGRQLSEYLFNQAETSQIDYTNVPTVVFSHPAIGTIGLTEAEAEEKYGKEDLTIYTNKFYSMYASTAGHREPCHFKLVCQGEDERVVGLHGIGEGVDEMIQGFGVAIKMGATKKDFDSVIAIHPTGAEEFVTMR